MTTSQCNLDQNEKHSETDTKNAAGSLDTLIHLIAGGVGGTTGAIFTCPLEVVKTRLQSSNSGFGQARPQESKRGDTGSRKMTFSDISSDKKGPSSKYSKVQIEFNGLPKLKKHLVNGIESSETSSILVRHSSSTSGAGLSSSSSTKIPSRPLNVWQCLRYIVETEGFPGLFKGLGPNLVGVAPSRAIYFFTYSTAKKNMNKSLPVKNRDTPFVHVVSAATAGFCASTCTNPIWLIKTRLQLDRASGKKSLTVKKCISNIHRSLGFLGFWKGVTASYWGISETMIHFVIYEFLKKTLAEYQDKRKQDEKTFIDFFGFMLCGACSKTCATIVAYPHEVARTRLREEGVKYKSFWQTLSIVAREEGRVGLYRGLVTQLIRQIPNTAIMMSTYELSVYLMTKYFIGNEHS